MARIGNDQFALWFRNARARCTSESPVRGLLGVPLSPTLRRGFSFALKSRLPRPRYLKFLCAVDRQLKRAEPDRALRVCNALCVQICMQLAWGNRYENDCSDSVSDRPNCDRHERLR
jgi:hypothetical protein